MIYLVGMMILAILGNNRLKFEIFVDLFSSLLLDFLLDQIVKIVLPDTLVLQLEIDERASILLIYA